jgi:hypothetical protein
MANGRNLSVGVAVDQILQKLDAFTDGGTLSVTPSSDGRRAADEQLNHASNSVRLASLFLAFYSTVDTSWDCDSVPTGIRGKWGDKRLANEFTQRNITLHNSITAFGENLGWKGNVGAARLKRDKRFERFAKTLAATPPNERIAIADYMVSRFAQSQRIVEPLPPVGAGVLTYGRARVLFEGLINIPSEGNIQQFLIAAMLWVHRRRFGFEIKTHHVHASDKFDTTAGDIEEFHNGTLTRAYEVTVRPDWKNRISDFRAKMDEYDLSKYVIIASDVGNDPDLAMPADMLRFVEPYGRDIAVIDILDFVSVFAAELTAIELREAVNKTYAFLSSPKLCGRPDIMDRYREGVERWLDAA